MWNDEAHTAFHHHEESRSTKTCEDAVTGFVDTVSGLSRLLIE